MNYFIKFFLFNVSIVLLLTSCGGGGGGTPSADTKSNVNLVGNVIDGYIKGANVWLDLDLDGIQDINEPSTTTDINGKYTLVINESTKLHKNYNIAHIIAKGGVDVDTGIDFPGTLSNVIKKENSNNNLTTLTTIVSKMANENISEDTTSEELSSILIDKSEILKKVLNLDPAANLEEDFVLNKNEDLVNVVLQIQNSINMLLPNMEEEKVFEQILNSIETLNTTNTSGSLILISDLINELDIDSNLKNKIHNLSNSILGLKDSFESYEDMINAYVEIVSLENITNNIETPTEPTPSTPTERTPSTPTEPTPSTPTEPTPSTPTEPTPSTPTEPTPSTPTEPTPSTPTEPVIMDMKVSSLTKAESFKLLTMATFGPTKELINEVESLGAEAWIDKQLNMNSAYSSNSDNWLTHLERTIHMTQGIKNSINYYNGGYFNEKNSDQDILQFQMFTWLENILGNNLAYPKHGEDQLRQRMAYALSQLIVTSNSAPRLNERSEGLAHFYDILAKNAFANYKDLLREISRSPAMGAYLSHAANKKASKEKSTRPDENFARELIQLFTIGLYELNLDGTPKGSSLVPTYNQKDVEELSKIMTGWHLVGSENWKNLAFNDGSYMTQMYFSPDYHEDEKDQYYIDLGDTDGYITLLGKKIALNATDAIKDGKGQTTNSGLDASLDVLFSHSNVAPYVSKHLIKHFVTSNPSPEYVQRVASVFNNDGTGVKGNLSAVLKSILLDKEAYSQNIEKGGKVKEPFLAFTQVLRALDVKPWDLKSGVSNNKGWEFINSNSDLNKFVYGTYAYFSPERHLNQAGMRSPSVFNFFNPDFAPSDDKFIENGLSAPEFKLYSDQLFANYHNLIRLLLKARDNYFLNLTYDITKIKYESGLSSIKPSFPSLDFFNQAIMKIDTSNLLKYVENIMEGDSNLDFSTINKEGQHQIVVNAIVEWIDIYLFGTNMSEEMSLGLKKYLNEGTNNQKDSLNPSYPNLNLDRHRLEMIYLVQDAILFSVTSPEFMIQK